ncbi:Glycine betaine transport ATP-binding protein OpuAA [Trichinella spiralis]|uniref:Glycine betaine transport ATP-binding protein OpuAA n=1 Tax=Trichinella spiralis TaxID=6334 RepID=A0ABR3KHK4_TRISP
MHSHCFCIRFSCQQSKRELQSLTGMWTVTLGSPSTDIRRKEPPRVGAKPALGTNQNQQGKVVLFHDILQSRPGSVYQKQKRRKYEGSISTAAATQRSQRPERNVTKLETGLFSSCFYITLADCLPALSL